MSGHHDRRHDDAERRKHDGVRVIAGDRLLGVACAMLKSRSVFDPKPTTKTA